MSERVDLEALADCYIDWNGSPMVDEEEPRRIPRVGELRAIVAELRRLRGMEARIEEAPIVGPWDTVGSIADKMDSMGWPRVRLLVIETGDKP